MSAAPERSVLRRAVASDVDRLLPLWALVSDEDGSAEAPWREHARAWFAGAVEDPATAWFPVLELGGVLVGTAVGTLEVGVPNPHSPRGRAVRLANVVTLPHHRGRGHGARLVHDVVEWARSIDADRVDLSASSDGQRLYDRLGFVLTSAPRMKLAL